MAGNPCVSILVPVYNMERYLEKCFDALTRQTLDDIEIIAVDDGSTDASPRILARYAENDWRVKIITKPNSGYGASMNRGLDEARGDYIGIVEPDDYPDRVMFEKLYKAAEKHKCDLVKCNYYRMYDSFEEPEWNLHGFGYDIPFGWGIDLRTKDVKVFDDKNHRWSDDPKVSVPNPMRKQDVDMYGAEMWVRQFDRVIKYWNRGIDTRPMARFYIKLINEVIDRGRLFESEKSEASFNAFVTTYEPLRDKMVEWLNDKEDC